MNEEYEDQLLREHIEQSTPEELFEELKNYSECQHQAKNVCNDARIRLPRALEEIEQAMERVGQPHEVGGPLAKAFEAVTLTLSAMKGVPENKVSEKQVVQYLEDYAVENKLDHVSIQYTATDKKHTNSRKNILFYCNKRGHSGMSSKSIDDSLGKLGVYMDKLGANR